MPTPKKSPFQSTMFRVFYALYTQTCLMSLWFLKTINQGKVESNIVCGCRNGETKMVLLTFRGCFVVALNDV